MRCPDCSKFVQMEAQDPEVELEVEGSDNSLRISGEVRCALACADCGTELKETTFDVDHEVDCPWPEDVPDHEHDFTLETSSEEATESGGGRYKKNMRGFSLAYTVTCECGWKAEGTIEDSLQASAWDELV